MAIEPIFEKKNIIVTGGAGFIGSHLCDELIKNNKVICIDNFSSGSEQNIDHLLQNPDFEFIKHDIVDPIDLESLPELEKFKVKFQGIQEIYHLACPTSPKNFEATIVQTALANSVGVKNILDIAVKYKSKFLFTSSSVVYGSRGQQKEIFKEIDLGIVDQLSPRACYDEGKRFAETLINTYRQAFGLDTKIARIFRTYGSRMKLSDGRMLPDFIFNALEGKDLVIYGTPEFSSSFCHISDMTQGLVRFMKGGQSGPVNLGSDMDVNLSEIAQKVIDMTGAQSSIIFAKPLLFMSPLSLPDITLAKERLGWFPITLLDDGIQDTINYSKANKTRLHPGSSL